MALELVRASYIFPEQQTIRLTIFAPWVCYW